MFDPIIYSDLFFNSTDLAAEFAKVKLEAMTAAAKAQAAQFAKLKEAHEKMTAAAVAANKVLIDPTKWVYLTPAGTWGQWGEHTEAEGLFVSYPAEIPKGDFDKGREDHMELVLLLDRAIPPHELPVIPEGVAPIAHLGPEIQIALDSPAGRVVYYNDTRTSPDEIIAWYERALLLAGHPA